MALRVLTGGSRAARTLGDVYYLQYAQLATASPDGMGDVLATPFYAERAALNANSRRALLGTPPARFSAAMRASAALYARTQREPALALPAAELRKLAGLPVYVCNFYGDSNDGMHTPAVSRAVADALGESATLVVSDQLAVWFGGLVRFVQAHSE